MEKRRKFYHIGSEICGELAVGAVKVGIALFGLGLGFSIGKDIVENKIRKERRK